MLSLDDIKDLHDKAYNYSEITRERASNDLVFYWLTQWDDRLLADSQLSYRGQFDVLRKAGRQILGDLEENQVQIDFEPMDERNEDNSEVVDGLYRADDNTNFSIESYETGKKEAVICGFGAWELYTEYESKRSGTDTKVIKRRPLHEANNTVFYDPNAKAMDKSDANYVSILSAYSEDGYRDLIKYFTGEEIDTINADDFKQPEQSYVFPWLGGQGKIIYVARFYHREKVTDTMLTMIDPFGQEVMLWESDLSEIMDELMDGGFEVKEAKEVERYQITRYIASGKEVLDECVIAGEHIPVIPCYGEYAYVEGECHYEGVTRLAKDPQRLRNFQLSYLADIVSRSPRAKPIFLQEQIGMFRNMYEEVGSENNYPYLLQQWKDAQGKELPLGPVGIMPEQPFPQSLIASIDISKQAVEDVASPGLPQDIADPDVSGKAVLALQARLDIQSIVYQQHFKHAKRRDAEVWVSMASEIIDTPRTAKMELPDGTKKEIKIMDTVIDEETGDVVVINDINGAEFDVKSRIGPSYHSQKEQTLEKLTQIFQALEPGNQMREIVLLKMFRLQDGVEFDDLRDFANKRLVMSGVKKPETDEEKAMAEQAAQQGEQPSAEMVLAQAEMLKGQAELKNADIKMMDLQLRAQNEGMKRNVDMFKAQTDRMDTSIDAAEAGAKIQNTNVDSIGKQLDNAAKAITLKPIKELTDAELFERIAAG